MTPPPVPKSLSWYEERVAELERERDCLGDALAEIDGIASWPTADRDDLGDCRRVAVRALNEVPGYSPSPKRPAPLPAERTD